MNENKNGAASPKWGRHPKESRKSHCVMVRFDDGEWLRFLAMYEKSGVYAKAVFLKAHFFGQPFRVATTTTKRSRNCAVISRRKRRWHCSTGWSNARRNWRY